LQRQSTAGWSALYLILVLPAFADSAGTQVPSASKASATARVTDVSTDHLRIRYDNEVLRRSDGSVSLVLEIVPRPRMHVYAPGADNYQVISLVLTAQPGVRARPITYPQSEIYFFEPLKERIPVYQKPFKLAAEVVVDVRSGPEPPKAMKITGHLDYQACDDKICFAPVSVPLAWTILR
jgi:hypothetical protein